MTKRNTCPGWTEPAGMSTKQALDSIEAEWEVARRKLHSQRGTNRPRRQRPAPVRGVKTAPDVDALYVGYQRAVERGKDARRAWWKTHGETYLAAVKRSRRRG